MNAHVAFLAVGDELLDGRVADTNAQWLGGQLTALGLSLEEIAVVKDDITSTVDTARRLAACGYGWCIVSGGLGPTSDDLTREALAELADKPLCEDARALATLAAFLEGRGRTMTQSQRKQASIPEGAELLDNPLGTACGFVLTHQGCTFVALPGVPVELQGMWQRHMVPRLAAGARRLVRLQTFGLAEADVGDRVAPVAAQFPQVRFAFRAAFPSVEVQLAAEDAGLLERVAREIGDRLGDSVYATGDQTLAGAVIMRLCALGQSVSVAESCTGGLVGDLLTDVPGSSAAFRLGVVAYANKAKTKLLGVEPQALEQHGAVSEAVVAAMAQQVRERGDSTYGLGISGIAGPTGGSEEKPVGTVFMALATPSEVTTRKHQLKGDRRRIKVLAAHLALDWLRRTAR